MCVKCQQTKHSCSAERGGHRSARERTKLLITALVYLLCCCIIIYYIILQLQLHVPEGSLYCSASAKRKKTPAQFGGVGWGFTLRGEVSPRGRTAVGGERVPRRGFFRCVSHLVQMDAGVHGGLGLVAFEVGLHRLLTHAHGGEHLADLLQHADGEPH